MLKVHNGSEIIYDADGLLILIQYVRNGSHVYYYPMFNSRGDVETLYTYQGELVARYYYDMSVIDRRIAAILGLNLVGIATVGALGNIVSDYIKGNIKSGKDVISSAAWGAGANSVECAATKRVAALKVKQVNNMPRAQRKSNIKRKLYRGSQANVNMNYHNYMSKTTSGKIGVVERTLHAFKSGIYSTITSTVVGLFIR